MQILQKHMKLQQEGLCANFSCIFNGIKIAE